MDTSVEYRAMCATAEVQEGWRPARGDVMWDKLYYRDAADEYVDILTEAETDPNSRGARDLRQQFTWLPLQHQLQAMVRERGYEERRDASDSRLAYDFGQWVGVRSIHDTGHMSMEQLWMCFVMFELHSKLWDGKEWVDGGVWMAAGTWQCGICHRWNTSGVSVCPNQACNDVMVAGGVRQQEGPIRK